MQIWHFKIAQNAQLSPISAVVSMFRQTPYSRILEYSRNADASRVDIDIQ
jgi:hypothetical protein